MSISGVNQHVSQQVSITRIHSYTNDEKSRNTRDNLDPGFGGDCRLSGVERPGPGVYRK